LKAEAVVIFYLCSSGCFDTINMYLRDWARSLRKRFSQIPYENLPNPQMLRNVAGTLIPHHVLFGSQWHVKVMDLVTPEVVREERDHQRRNPHRAELESIFPLAQICVEHRSSKAKGTAR
jgi:hypothetical protein